MKANFYSKFSILIIFLVLSGLTGFSSGRISEVYANHSFQIAANDETIEITMDKHPWESFTLAINNMDIANNPLISLELLSIEDITIRIDMTDGEFMSCETGIVEKSISGSPAYQNTTFDFSGLLSHLDLFGDIYLVVYINPGKSFSGNITMKNFHSTRESLNPGSSMTGDGFKMFPLPATTYTNIDLPDGSFNYVNIIDMSGQMVSTSDISTYQGSIFRQELNNLPKGIYTVQLTGGGKTLSEKLIIN